VLVVPGKPLVCRGAASKRAKNPHLVRVGGDLRYPHGPFGTKSRRREYFMEPLSKGQSQGQLPRYCQYWRCDEGEVQITSEMGCMRGPFRHHTPFFTFLPLACKSLAYLPTSQLEASLLPQVSCSLRRISITLWPPSSIPSLWLLFIPSSFSRPRPLFQHPLNQLLSTITYYFVPKSPQNAS